MSVMNQVEVLRAACCVAGLDQSIDEQEEKIIRKLADRVGVGAASLRAMMQRALADPDFYTRQFRVLKADAEQAVTTLLKVAVADGELTSAERIVIGHLAEQLGMSHERFDQLAEIAGKSIED